MQHYNSSDLCKFTTQNLLDAECATSFDSENFVFCARTLYGYYNKQTFTDWSFSQERAVSSVWCGSNMRVKWKLVLVIRNLNVNFLLLETTQT